MKKENCLDCLYGNINNTTIIMLDLVDNDIKICEHPNSPYYQEYVDEHKYCKFYINEYKYFMDKDRKEKIDKLNNKNIFRKK